MHPVTYIWLLTYLIQFAATAGPAFILWLAAVTLQMSESFGLIHVIQAIVNGAVLVYSWESFNDATKQRQRIREWMRRRR